MRRSTSKFSSPFLFRKSPRRWNSRVPSSLKLDERILQLWNHFSSHKTKIFPGTFEKVYAPWNFFNSFDQENRGWNQADYCCYVSIFCNPSMMSTIPDHELSTFVLLFKSCNSSVLRLNATRFDKKNRMRNFYDEIEETKSALHLQECHIWWHAETPVGNSIWYY